MVNSKPFITANEAAEISNSANVLIYKEAARKNIERWCIKALEVITEAARNGKFYAEFPIYTERGFPFKEDAFGVDDFCKWLNSFGYDVDYSLSHIKIHWEPHINVDEI